MEQRLPMRKPISMVQYWVDTGNLLNCVNKPANSDCEFPRAEDCFESTHNVDFQSLATHSAEVHSNVDETLGNKNLKIITSSNSSIDTAAYILANNNVTKKAETVAIVEGSKINTELSPTKTLQQTIEKSRNTDQIILSKTNNLQLNKENTNIPHSSLYKSYVDKITENIKNSNFDKKCKINMNSTNKKQEHHIYPSFFSDSEGSLTPHFQNNQSQTLLNKNNQTDNDLSKYMKRKKLYNRSDSPAEFTPVSEDNLSPKVSRVLLENCLTLRSEHPALETPKLGSRFTFHTRFGKTRFKRKIPKHKNFSLLTATNEEENKNRELIHSSQKKSVTQKISNNGPTLSQISSGNDKCIKVPNINNSMDILRQSFTSESNKIQKPVSQIKNDLNSCNDFLTNKFKLKACKVLLEILPCKNYSSKSSVNKNENSTVNKKFDSAKNEVTREGVDRSICGYALMSDKATANDKPNFTCSENNSSEKITKTVINKFKTHNDREKQQKLSNKKNSVYSSDKLKILEMTGSTSNVDKISTKCFKRINNGNLHVEKPKYVIVDSSSDESDLIVPLSSITNYSVSKSRNSKKLSSEELTHQSRKHALSVKETVESSITAENGEKIDSQTHEKISKHFSNEQKKSINKVLKNSEADVDVQCNEMKEHVCANESQNNMSPADCNRRKHVKKTCIISSSSEKETSMPIKKIVRTNDSTIESNEKAESRNSSLNDREFASNSIIANNQVAVGEICLTKNGLDNNNKLSKLLTKHETQIQDKMQNKQEGLSSYKSSNKCSSRASGLHFDLENDNASENAPKIESNKSQIEKRTRRRIKRQKITDSAKVKTVVSQKNSTKKRKSFEMDCSSDEECIIPLKRKEQTSNV